MQVKTITYQRVKNLGNYESERLEMSAHLDDDDDVREATIALRSLVTDLLNFPTNKEHKTEPEEGF